MDYLIIVLSWYLYGCITLFILFFIYNLFVAIVFKYMGISEEKKLQEELHPIELTTALKQSILSWIGVFIASIVLKINIYQVLMMKVVQVCSTGRSGRRYTNISNWFKNGGL